MHFQGKHLHWEVSGKVNMPEMIFDSILLPCLLCRNILPALHVYSPVLPPTPAFSFFLTQCPFEWKLYHRIRNVVKNYQQSIREIKEPPRWHVPHLDLILSQTLAGGKWMQELSVQGPSHLQKQYRYLSYPQSYSSQKKFFIERNHLIFNLYWTHYIPYPVLNTLHVLTQKYLKSNCI